MKGGMVEEERTWGLQRKELIFRLRVKPYLGRRTDVFDEGEQSRKLFLGREKDGAVCLHSV